MWWVEPLGLVGRAEELAELNRAWRRLEAGPAGGPQIAVITGPAGIGKSRLVSTALAGIDADIHVGAARLHSPAPYDWLAAVLSHDVGAQEQLEIAVPADALAWLRQDIDVPRERYAPDALLRIAVRVVRALVGARPAVLVVEDLHALDPASLNLIAALATTPLPILLIATSRQTRAPLVEDVLARLTGTPQAIRQHLAPLDRSSVHSALQAVYGDVDTALVDEVLQRTAGNPFQLTELLATTRSANEFRPEGDDLTARERDVLACIADGMSNQQVATCLGISIRTVTVHVSNLLRKTRSRSRTDAAIWAVRHGVQSSATTTSS